ncbi:hypothetical protein KDH83_17485 [Achromobacter sp. Marseille-Q0513]|uniref:hypothetical protein n=1 Tax=Achromobacter sp. Marseille-Q0513 TaxID=2829161 RepID=UPI001B919DAA|nr:hypothetical protein [Achromobacter sp. Marseille-Q0513]MBR8655098.1 hypothetical protein [Achromobacter sp. Marseille-Q0513]
MALLIWLLRLLLSRRARSRFAARPVLGAALMLVLALAASFYVSFQYQMWRIDREFARQDAARRVTLAEAQTLGGVLMPVGARLTLAKEGALETYTEALFDSPVLAYGVRVSRIERYLHTDYDSKTYEEIRRYPHTIHLWGAGPQSVEGWQCDTSQKLRLRVEDPDGRPEFAECVLAVGNPIEGGTGTWPAGTEVLRMNGTVYTDGHREPANWMVRVHDPLGLPLAGLTLGRPTVYLDENHRLLTVSEAELACPLTLGEMRYPAGTQVKTAGYPLRQRFPSQSWVFSPVAPGHATRAGQPQPVNDGMSVVQAPDGAVLGVLSNEEAGVLRFARIIVNETDPQEPPVRCP